MIKKFLLVLSILLTAFLTYHYKAVFYGLGQAAGQAEVLWNAKPIDQLMNSSDFPDSTKAKFKYIQKVKQFAQDSLGLNPSKNYSTFYDQKGKPILWVVTASPEFEIKAHQWSFPLAGKFSYKGFFDHLKAEKEAEKMKQKGYDTEIDEVNAWSTLGWFRDPILSSMLNRSDGSLAELIIHELTHATIYRKDAVEFNENFATFIGRKGAEAFLKSHFGSESEELKEYRESQARKTYFKSFVQKAIEELNNIYASFDEKLSLAEKRKIKAEAIENLKNRLANSSYYQGSVKGKKRLANFTPNNAYFSGYSTYNANQTNLQSRLKSEFNGDLKALITAIKQE
ncbi:MAG: aminopeptidase [Vicingaceae bacterium]